MRLDQFCYADTVIGRNLKFLAGVVHRKVENGDLAGAALAARTGAAMTTCRVWASVANLLESLASN